MMRLLRPPGFFAGPLRFDTRLRAVRRTSRSGRRIADYVSSIEHPHPPPVENRATLSTVGDGNSPPCPLAPHLTRVQLDLDGYPGFATGERCVLPSRRCSPRCADATKAAKHVQFC